MKNLISWLAQLFFSRKAKTWAEIEALKIEWLRNPSWVIEATNGFYEDDRAFSELVDFRNRCYQHPYFQKKFGPFIERYPV